MLACVLSGILSTPCSAEIVFDWSDSTVPKEQRQRIEEIVHTAAAKYKEEKYADLGVYDFAAASEKYTLHFENDLGQPGEYWMGAEGGAMFLDDVLSTQDAFLEIVVFHEFSHAYDYTVTENIRWNAYQKAKNQKERKQARQNTAWLTNIVATTEYRAKKKEHQFVEEIKDRIPTKLYDKLQERY